MLLPYDYIFVNIQSMKMLDRKIQLNQATKSKCSYKTLHMYIHMVSLFYWTYMNKITLKSCFP